FRCRPGARGGAGPGGQGGAEPQGPGRRPARPGPVRPARQTSGAWRTVRRGRGPGQLMGTGGVRCMLMRGGTSKGAYFLAEDLPADPAARDELLLRVMGSPDPRQIDGIGGGHPLTSKVAVVSPSEDPDCDVDYLFLQVNVDEPVVSDRQNCGNILAGIGPFAVERGLIGAGGESTTARIHMVNSRAVVTATFATP